MVEDLNTEDCEKLINYVYKAYGKTNSFSIPSEVGKPLLKSILCQNIVQASTKPDYYPTKLIIGIVLKRVFSIKFSQIPSNVKGPWFNYHEELWNILIKFRLEHGI